MTLVAIGNGFYTATPLVGPFLLKGHLINPTPATVGYSYVENHRQIFMDLYSTTFRL